MNTFLYKLTLLSLTFALISCAQKGSISGGEKDITPPVLLSARPDTLSTNVPTDLKKIDLHFDEFIMLRDFVKNIIISPPIDPMPSFHPQGTADKTLKITFNDSLKPNTTYNISFGRSLVDYNEGNVKPYFNYVFSTGNFIDSLKITGNVYDPSTKKLPENIIVGLYEKNKDYKDSLILSEKPFYVGKVDSVGNFSLNYLRDGNYKLIAFTDKVNNTHLDREGESLAYYQEDINPKNSPSNIKLELFMPNPNFEVKEIKQNDYGRFDFIMKGKPKKIKITALNHDFPSAKIIHKSFSDTLQFWFNPVKDTITDKNKRISFSIDHNEIIDTLKASRYDNSIPHSLTLSTNTNSYVPIDEYIIKSNYPIKKIDSSFIKIKEDSTNITYKLKPINDFEFALNFPIKFEKSYKMEFLPGAITDFFEQVNDTVNINQKIENERAYGNIKIKIQNKPNGPNWVQLINDKEKVILSKYTIDDIIEFKRITPGNYYLKLIADSNANGKWDTGNFFTKKQPEPIFLYKEILEVKAFWDLEETWILGEENPTTELPKENNPPSINEKPIPPIEEKNTI